MCVSTNIEVSESSFSDPAPSTSAHIQSAIVEDEIPASQPTITPPENQWTDPCGRNKQFDFSTQSGISSSIREELEDVTPIKIFEMFVSEDILEMMVEQTNIYAEQTFSNAQSKSTPKWVPTNMGEMKEFLGIICYMGLVRKPTIRCYWSQDILYKDGLIPSVMSRNRFEMLLRLWHFSDNKEQVEGDRLHKISPLVEKLVANFQKNYKPSEIVCVDESLVPYKGRLAIKQYIPNKSSKYGIKLFKLCCAHGYTWNLCVYCGKERDPSGAVPTKVVMKLSEGLLDAGRTIVTDNYYSSLQLANCLLDRETHLLGTLRKNRKGNPKEVIGKQLKKGEVIAKENDRGVVILKWKDKRDVLMISTKHTAEMEVLEKNGREISKPKMVLDYNKGKSSIDISDQMSKYNTSLRRTVKWYHKLAVELLFGTALLNAQIIYNLLAAKKLSITAFKEEIAKELLKKPAETEVCETTPPTSRRRSLQSHRFDKKPGKFDKVRKYCKGCYAKCSKGETTKNKVKKVVTFCRDCVDEPHFCLECFHSYHRN